MHSSFFRVKWYRYVGSFSGGPFFADCAFKASGWGLKNLGRRVRFGVVENNVSWEYFWGEFILLLFWFWLKICIFSFGLTWKMDKLNIVFCYKCDKSVFYVLFDCFTLLVCRYVPVCGNEWKFFDVSLQIIFN